MRARGVAPGSRVSRILVCQLLKLPTTYTSRCAPWCQRNAIGTAHFSSGDCASPPLMPPGAAVPAMPPMLAEPASLSFEPVAPIAKDQMFLLAFFLLSLLLCRGGRAFVAVLGGVLGCVQASDGSASRVFSLGLCGGQRSQISAPAGQHRDRISACVSPPATDARLFGSQSELAPDS